MPERFDVDLTAAADTQSARIRRGAPKDADRLERAMLALTEDPRPSGCSALRGLPDVLRIRVGDYRVCYTIERDVLVVLVLIIHTRDDVCPQLRRLLGR
jgi:mRNA interferase RelE/StbE